MDDCFDTCVGRILYIPLGWELLFDIAGLGLNFNYWIVKKEGLIWARNVETCSKELSL